MDDCTYVSAAQTVSVAKTEPSPKNDTAVLEREDISGDNPWVTIVWDDPINLMLYVTYVLQTVFGYPEDKARKLMLQVHTEGKAVVASGTQEKVEGYVKELQTFGLWATMQKGG